VPLPKLAPGAGLKILIDHRGLTTRWPFWGHDVAGTFPESADRRDIAGHGRAE
jgi:hypothetical protein